MKKHIVCALLTLASCHDKRPPQPSEEQSQQLNDAEDMLNDMAQNEEWAQNEEGPEANASSPSNSSD